MENQITNQTHLIVLMNNVRIWITEAEFNSIRDLLGGGKVPFIEVCGSIINTSTITYAGPRNKMDEADRIKHGDWQCRDCGRWHARGEECGCQGGRY